MPLTVKLNCNVEWPTEGHHGENDITPASSIVIDGNGYTITATGSGVTPLGDAEAPMTLKNVKIVDESVSYNESAWEFSYLEMGGKVLICVDVDFVDPITVDSEYATFTNCSFVGHYDKNSTSTTQYGVWVSNGDSIFTNCIFTGTRAMKICDQYTSEVGKVVVDGCYFNDISEKPGVVIDNRDENDVSSIEGMTVIIKNSTFINCAAGDQSLYIYETDNAIPTLDNNTVLSSDKVAEGLYYDTANKTFTIISKDGLMNLREALINIAPGEANIQTVNLLCDVDLTGENWMPLDSMWVNFNGNNHTISNLTAGFDSTGRRSGFWGYAGAVSINDLTLCNVNVAGSQVGAFAGSAEGLKINNCYLSGINTVTYVDGVEDWNGIGAITGVLTNSTIYVTITEGTTVDLDKQGFATVTECTYQDNLTGYIQENKGKITNNGILQVYPIVSVEDADGFIENLEKAGIGEIISLGANIKIDPASMSNAYGKTGINVKNGQTIDGNGNTLDIKGAGGTWDSGISTTGGIIRNITITGSFRGVFINHNSAYSQRVILENVIIDGTTYTISCDQGNNKGLTANGSTFKGWTSYAATIGDVKFNNCYFGEGNGYSFCRPYATTEFVDCDFEEGFEIDPRAAVTFENCTINGVKLTADNLATLVTSNIANATVK